MTTKEANMRVGIVVLTLAALGLPAAAVAQQSGKTAEQIRAEATEKRRAKLIADCKANRGVDCDSPKAIEEMERANRPLTPEEYFEQYLPRSTAVSPDAPPQADPAAPSAAAAPATPGNLPATAAGQGVAQ